MKKASGIIFLIFAGFAFGFLINSLTAEAQRAPKDPSVHFFQFRFTMPFGQTRQITLARQDSPVRVEVSITNIAYANLGPFGHSEQEAPPVVLSGAYVQESTTGWVRGDFVRLPVGPCEVSGSTVECEDDLSAFLRVISTPVNIKGTLVVGTVPRQFAVIIPRGDFNFCVNMWF